MLHARLHRVKKRVGRLARNRIAQASVRAKAIHQSLGRRLGPLIHIGAHKYLAWRRTGRIGQKTQIEHTAAHGRGSRDPGRKRRFQT